ncbi:MAG TPA: rhodanese-like domain-containing protein, partial [Thermoanaerobaculia bacterium]
LMKKQLAQIAVLIGAAVVIALASNAMAGRTRKLVLPGWYPNATQPPTRVEAPPAPIAAAPATTTAMSPAPGAPRIEVPTTTIERPAGQPEPSTATVATATTPQPRIPAIPPPVPAPQPSAPAQQQPHQPSIAKFQPHPDKPYLEIGGDDVAALHTGGALFLDARRTSVYEQGHIAGARPFSVWESDVDEKVNALYEERSDPAEQNKPIVIYCSGGACEDSHMLSQKLWGVQFNNVYVYKDGYPDWVKRGGATKTGAAH